VLKNKKIVLGVTGSIAAYKSAALVRLLIKAGAQVKVVMTPAAKDFITAPTLSTLSKNPVLSEFIANNKGEWNNHVDLGLWADIMLIAPASANTLAAMANGSCNNLLQAVYLSARCKVCAAPAMDLDMWLHPATQQNISKLKGFGVHIIDPENGELASGLTGKGRMAEPEFLVGWLKNYFSKKQQLSGKTILVTAGPTYEAIDPVRFIGNHSTGKMGYAIAESLAEKGARVILVSGPTQLEINHPCISVIKVVSALQMYDACIANFKQCNTAILSAAVADFKPKKTSSSKIKKEQARLQIELEKTTDILAELGKLKTKKQTLIGFALETDNEKENALKKIKAKNLDFIVLNSLQDKGAGFGYDTNKVTLLFKDGKSKEFPLLSKKEVAELITDELVKTHG
jgi:phosphopantothenoylcysteine decarboxylase / phosphopantothenate---cysteine ligase